MLLGCTLGLWGLRWGICVYSEVGGCGVAWLLDEWRWDLAKGWLKIEGGICSG